ncbi:tRNA pseudouridine32 synthase / 23S rRNA pseudouridine746 synthase [Allopseudospirillum japonicum]|uniref:tRNA pseudouridine32 synthase / 23S rRNA pseudouridine746 synthase n=1 Tax=Allopseudospirillum japonicum TaxID=64971 RepID=A0A1H6S8F0_9GAMM|nr:pseudouridine synthase [Allopseudospirillum japonicum]SEI64313.1 tRNA pseudouridine32 synthase / 23S rRNA pseudouridine746 synthase [Allopseudospirillum japonicum]
MARSKKSLRKPQAPLPQRLGVRPSYLRLPSPPWPDLLSFLIHKFPHIPAMQLKQRLAQGEFFDAQGQAITLDTPYRAHTLLWYYRDVPEEAPIAAQETIIYQDDYILVADKPHGLATAPGGQHVKETLVVRLRHQLNLPELEAAHRLDKATAGLVLLCKKAAYRGAYQQLFQQGQIKKVYHAIAPLHEDLQFPLVYRSRIIKGDPFFIMQEVSGTPNSETHIALITQKNHLGLYQLIPITGRQHQLRVHLAALGIPIQHDPWYPQIKAPTTQVSTELPLQLLAFSLAFQDPITGNQHLFYSKNQLQL